jgi:hypothetical protein
MLTTLAKSHLGRDLVATLLLGATTMVLVAGCVVRERGDGYGSYGYRRDERREEHRDWDRRDDDRRERDRHDDDRGDWRR